MNTAEPPGGAEFKDVLGFVLPDVLVEQTAALREGMRAR
jgi:hypothetical protein